MTVKERVEKKDHFQNDRFLVLDPEFGQIESCVSDMVNLKPESPVWDFQVLETKSKQ